MMAVILTTIDQYWFYFFHELPNGLLKTKLKPVV